MVYLADVIKENNLSTIGIFSGGIFVLAHSWFALLTAKWFI